MPFGAVPACTLLSHVEKQIVVLFVAVIDVEHKTIALAL